MSEFRIRKAEQLFTQALQARAAGDDQRSARLLHTCLELYPDHRAAHLELARSLEREGQVVEAAAHLAAAVERFADDDELRFFLAYLQADAGQFFSARAHLLDLLDRHPSDENLLCEYALLLRNTHQYAALIEHLTPTVDTTSNPQLLGLLAQAQKIVGSPDTETTWARVRGLDPELAPPIQSVHLQQDLLQRGGHLLLGTAHDDGQAIPRYSTYIISNDDVIETIVRFVRCAQHFLWSWPSVVAVTEEADVLACLLARALDLPNLPRPTSARDANQLAQILPSPATMPLAVASILAPGWQRQYPWATVLNREGSLFAFGVVDIHAHAHKIPSVLGIPCGDRVCFPWRRLGEARIGFTPEGLLEALPLECDGRPAPAIADDYWPAICERLQGEPNTACRHLLETFTRSQHHLHPGLRVRADAPRLPFHSRKPVPKSVASTPNTFRTGPRLSVETALSDLETRLGREAVPAHEDLLAALEAAFHRLPPLRIRIADLLFRLAPARFGTFLAGYFQEPTSVPERERECLVHLFGCNPWSPEPHALMSKWLDLAASQHPSAFRSALRSEFVQSKYGLLFALHSGAWTSWIEQLRNDSPSVVLGLLRWMQDEPAAHGECHRVLGLVHHANPDIVYETLCLAHIASHKLPLSRLRTLICDTGLPTRITEVALMHLAQHPFAEVANQLQQQLDVSAAPARRAAATRALVLHPDPEANLQLAAWIRQWEAAQPVERQVLHALNACESFAAFEPILLAFQHIGHIKTLVSACQSRLIGFDNTRLIDHIRRFPTCYALDPVLDFADYVYRHGSPDLDTTIVYNALGSTDPRSAYQAMAVLAAWGDRKMAASLEAALDYTDEHAQPALEARLHDCCVNELPRYFDRLEQHLQSPLLWQILRRLAQVPERAAVFTSWTDHSPSRAHTWAAYCEDLLRCQIPRPYRLGAQSADFHVMAALLPGAFASLHRRVLYGVPDRFAVDLLTFLGSHNLPLARAYARMHVDSRHFGMRACALSLASAAPRSPTQSD